MFLILPVGVDYRARRYPVVTFTLMGICTAVYLVTLVCALSGDATNINGWVRENLWLIPAENHWWTYITHQFVHAGIMHLAGNMVYLFLFGSCVEDIIGRVHYIIFYLLCGFVAALTHIMISADHFSSIVALGGASGAISGCIGGFLLLMVKTDINFKWIFFLYFRVWNGDFSLPAWVVITFWFLEDLLFMILTMLVKSHRGGVAFAAHVGGTLAGMGFMALEKWRMKRAGIERVEVPEYEEEAPPAVVQVVSRAQRMAAAPRAEARPRYRVALQPEAATVAAASETPAIHLTWSGAQSGPFTVSQVRQMFVAGQIPAEAFYWQEGMEEWRTADELREPGAG